MLRSVGWVVALASLAGITYGTVRLVWALPLPKDELRWVKIENYEIFETMGVRAWRLHVPAAQLEGKSQFILKMSRDDQEPEKVLAGRLSPRRKASDSLDVTAVCYFHDAVPGQAKQVTLTLASDEFHTQITKGNPLPGFNGYARSNELNDLASGIELCTFSLVKDEKQPDEKKQVRLSLWLE